MKDVQALIDQHEKFKSKGLELSVPDMFSWIELKEKMKFKVIELKSQAVELKQKLDKEKALRVLALKSEVDDGGKKLTEKSIDSTIRLEFFDKDQELNALTKYRELLLECADNILEYVNVVKLNLKNDLLF